MILSVKRPVNNKPKLDINIIPLVAVDLFTDIILLCLMSILSRSDSYNDIQYCEYSAKASDNLSELFIDNICAHFTALI